MSYGAQCRRKARRGGKQRSLEHKEMPLRERHNLLRDGQDLSGGESTTFVLTHDGIGRVPVGVPSVRWLVTEKHREFS